MLSSRTVGRLLCTPGGSLSASSSKSLNTTAIRLKTSAWINAATADSDASLKTNKIDVERKFTDENVQQLLTELTGMDLENKVFKHRRTAVQQRSNYALMTEERLDQTLEKMRSEAELFLQPVPLKEPRADAYEVLSKDKGIAGFDQSRFIFTDITFDATDQDRTVVVREVDGTLRTATPEEHDRMNRVYYEKPNRPINPPALFTDPWLKNALDRDEHEFVMDWVCWFYEPDDPAFVKLSTTIFDRTVEAEKFDVLHSTRHFGTMMFYLALNGNTGPILNWFGGLGRLADASRLIRLQKVLHPDWRMAISTQDSDRKIIEDFMRQNHRVNLPDLRAYLKFGLLKSERTGDVELKQERVKMFKSSYKKTFGVTSRTVGTTGGPLGSMTAEYPVHLKVGDSNVEEQRPPRRSSRFDDGPRGVQRPRGDQKQGGDDRPRGGQRPGGEDRPRGDDRPRGGNKPRDDKKPKDGGGGKPKKNDD